MTMTNPTTLPQNVGAQLPNQLSGGEWYAVYTCARHEKRVAEQMERRRLHGFVPLYRATHWWKDRRKEVVLALFPSYVFVHLALQDRLLVLEIPGVVNIVSSQGKPIPLPAEEIEPFRRAYGGAQMEPHPYLQAGRRVRLRRGPMAGLEGILLRRKDGLRLVVSIEILMRSVAVEVNEADVEPIPVRSPRKACPC
jgi:transcription antitermination factor NusG